MKKYTLTSVDELFLFFFPDISKVFDRVWHSGLLFNLQEHSFSDSLLTWFNNYVRNRKQKVVNQSAESNYMYLPLSAGVQVSGFGLRTITISYLGR